VFSPSRFSQGLVQQIRWQTGRREDDNQLDPVAQGCWLGVGDQGARQGDGHKRGWLPAARVSGAVALQAPSRGTIIESGEPKRLTNGCPGEYSVPGQSDEPEAVKEAPGLLLGATRPSLSSLACLAN
jgi:hypothetical protein